jgi:hypothetical protein
MLIIRRGTRHPHQADAELHTKNNARGDYQAKENDRRSYDGAKVCLWGIRGKVNAIPG